MEFNEKLQELRKKKGLTQEELAQTLYVSRTAVSKWELGRGYPNIESLKEIARFFGVTIDELFSGKELLAVAEEDKKRTKKKFLDLVYGLLDISMVMLFFLPLFAGKENGEIQSVSLIALYGVREYLKAAYFINVLASVITGSMTLALQNCNRKFWLKIKVPLSQTVGAILALLFIISSQPYAAVFAFVLLGIKALIAANR